MAQFTYAVLTASANTSWIFGLPDFAQNPPRDSSQLAGWRWQTHDQIKPDDNYSQTTWALACVSLMVATLHSAGTLVDRQMLTSIGSQRSKRQRSNWQHSWLFRWEIHLMVLTDSESFRVHFSFAHQSYNDFQGESATTFHPYPHSSPWAMT